MSIYNALNIARTGLQVTEVSLNTKTQNIAASGADAYKKQYHVTSDLPYLDKSGVGTTTSTLGTINPTGTQIGMGVQTVGIYRDFSQGEHQNTGNPLDVLIDGEGFFIVTLPNGLQGFTRLGALQKNANGEIVMPKTGYVVQPGITIPTNAIQIDVNPDGQVYVTTADNPNPQLVGQFQIATFANTSGLKAYGDSTFLETPASGAPDIGTPNTVRRGSIKHGWREGSNVNAVEEMTDLIRIEKTYDMITKSLKTIESMLSSLLQVR